VKNIGLVYVQHEGILGDSKWGALASTSDLCDVKHTIHMFPTLV